MEENTEILEFIKGIFWCFYIVFEKEKYNPYEDEYIENSHKNVKQTILYDPLFSKNAREKEIFEEIVFSAFQCVAFTTIDLDSKLFKNEIKVLKHGNDLGNGNESDYISEITLNKMKSLISKGKNSYNFLFCLFYNKLKNYKELRINKYLKYFGYYQCEDKKDFAFFFLLPFFKEINGNNNISYFMTLTTESQESYINIINNAFFPFYSEYEKKQYKEETDKEQLYEKVIDGVRKMIKDFISFLVESNF